MLFLELQPLQKKDFVMVFTVMGPARPRLEDLETLNLISMYFFFRVTTSDILPCLSVYV